MNEDANAMVGQIAANLRRLMASRGLSPQRLSERSLLSAAEVEAFLDGTEELRVDAVFMLAGALEVEAAVLLEGVEWIPGGRDGAGYRIRLG
jgi:transcriptional regulator with XRE-family HTH domain